MNIRIFLSLLVILTGVSSCINPTPDTTYYSITNDAVYYKENKLVEVDITSAEILGNVILRDSSHVYLNGKLLDWADASSFKLLEYYSNGGGRYYADKNGIYSFNLFGKLTPISGYDHKTFETIGEYYKDKDHAYQFDLYANPRLQKIKLPDGTDLPSLKAISNRWYCDKQRVYYQTFYGFSPANDIDRESVENIDGVYIKDKNRVYVWAIDTVRGMMNGVNYQICDSLDTATIR
jgi:hypothetical protein